jgi:hypothetical protein
LNEEITALMIMNERQSLRVTSGMGRQVRMFFNWPAEDILLFIKGLGSWTTIVRLPTDGVSKVENYLAVYGYEERRASEKKIRKMNKRDG